MEIVAIDPGTEQSAYVVWNGKQVLDSGIVENAILEAMLHLDGGCLSLMGVCVIEKIASYGMAVGQTVFETVYWTGRFACAFGPAVVRVPRKEVCLHICHSARAKDANISAALKDRFGDKPTKNNPNPVYGDIKLKADEWQAFALAVTWFDKNVKN